MKLKRVMAMLVAVCLCLCSFLPAFADANFDDDGNRTYEDGLVDEDDFGDVNSDDIHQEQYQDRTDEIFLWNEDATMIVYRQAREIYNSLVAKLIAFDLWENRDGEYVTKVTRGEYADILAKLYQAGFRADVQSFSDVPPEQDYYNEIEFLHSLGIISGGEDGTYQPDELISYADAVVMLVRVMGYEEYAQPLGAYPANYMLTARRMDLIDGVSEQAEADTLNRMDVVEMLDFLLDAYIAQTGYENPDGAVYYAVSRNSKTLLQSVRNIRYEAGIVKAAGRDYIDGGKELAEGAVLVGETLYAESGVDARPWLGYHVDCYYKPDGQERKLVFLEAEENANQVLTLEEEQIKTCRDGRIEYLMKGSTNSSSAVIAAKTVKMNGFAPEPFEDIDLLSAQQATLIDNNQDGRYDVVFVDRYRICVSSGASEDAGKIYDYYKKSAISVEFDDPDTTLTDISGNPVDAYYIKDKSVLGIGTNKAGDKTRVVISNDKVTGTVNRTYDLENYEDARVVVEEKSYRISSNAIDFLVDETIEPGGAYLFYLDHKGRIAGFDKQSSTGREYGYLIGVAKSGTLDVKTSFKIYSYTYGMREYAAADKVEIDGRKSIKNEEITGVLERAVKSLNSKMAGLDDRYQQPSELYHGGVLYVRQPVWYLLNDDGKVKMIDTPLCGEDEDTDKRNTCFGRSSMTLYDDFVRRNQAEQINPGGTFFRNVSVISSDRGNSIGVAGGVKIFLVPNSNDFDVINDEDNYDRAKIGYIQAWKSYPESVTDGQPANRLEAYNVGLDRSCDTMVYYTDLSQKITFDKTTPLTVVTELVEGLNEDGDRVTKLCGNQGAAQVEIPLAEGVSMTKQYRGPEDSVVTSEVKRGDIIRYETNAKGELVRYVKVFSLRDEDDPNYVIAGNEVGSTLEYSQLAPTMIAVSDGKYAANGHDNAHIGQGRNELDSGTGQVGGANYSFDASYRVIYATALYRDGGKLVIKADLNSVMGKIPGNTEICEANAFDFLCIDEERDEIYVPTADEIVSEYHTSPKEASRIILHTEGGKQRMLILVKRKQA